MKTKLRIDIFKLISLIYMIVMLMSCLLHPIFLRGDIFAIHYIMLCLAELIGGSGNIILLLIPFLTIVLMIVSMVLVIKNRFSAVFIPIFILVIDIFTRIYVVSHGFDKVGGHYYIGGLIYEIIGVILLVISFFFIKYLYLQKRMRSNNDRDCMDD